MNRNISISLSLDAMKKTFFALALCLTMACGNSSERTSKDLTDENISPNQTQTEEEAARKDSISGDVTQSDTALGIDREKSSRGARSQKDSVQREK